MQNTKGSTNTKSFADNDRPIEKNTNPEIDKIEREILTALKRLGGSDDDDDGDGDSYGDSSEEDFIYPTAKKVRTERSKTLTKSIRNYFFK